MRLLKAVSVGLICCLFAGAAWAAEVQQLGWQAMDRWLSGSNSQVTARFVDHTIQIDVTRKALGGMKGGPSTGPMILYLGKGGKLLTWTSRSKTVGTGRWEIRESPLVDIPCFYFDGPKGRSECFFGGTANYVQAASGNVFGLQAGASVPVKLGRRSTIASVANKLGL